MKNKLFFILFYIILILCCEKKQENKFNDYIKEVQDKTIEEKYYPEYINTYDPELLLLFEVEGNFTNSGNREFLGFYQEKEYIYREGKKYDEIDFIYCFVLDSANEKIEKTYLVSRYHTIPFIINTEFCIDDDPMKDLGREILWLDRRIGCIGDFNENLKEELYLFISGGLGINPLFYEFNGMEFVTILDQEYKFARVIGVDVSEKIIHFDSTSRSYGTFSIIWDIDKQIYKWLAGTRK